MDVRKQYCEELLEWCHTAELNWANMKPRFTNLFDLESLNEWEESCRQLKMKLQKNHAADIHDYEIAKNLYDHLDQLYREIMSLPEDLHREETVEELEMDEEYLESDLFEIIEVDPDQEFDMNEPDQIEEVYLETEANLDDMENGPDFDSEEQTQYRDDLLAWCNHLYSNWSRNKPELENVVKTEALKKWETLCCELREKLESGAEADYADYETARTLYDQWKMLLEDSEKVEIEV